jgi:hypothetical protein
MSTVKKEKEKWLSKTGLSMETPLSGITGPMRGVPRTTSSAGKQPDVRSSGEQPGRNPHLDDDALYQTANKPHEPHTILQTLLKRFITRGRR